MESTFQIIERAKANAEKFLSGRKGVSPFSESCVVLPGLCDVHVHFREPGFVHKETIKTGSRSAARGGFTAVCTMPNLNPVPDNMDHLKVQLDAVESTACIRVIPYGAVTVGEKGETLADMDAMSESVCAFSDDGRGIQSEELMLSAMEKAKRLGKVIAAHCEVNELIRGGYIHDGVYARSHGHRGISSESEYAQIERDIRLAEKTGCSYHVCHVSTQESVEMIRRAKSRGVDITCETAPHYLVLCDEDIKEEGRFKMNPPLRSKRDMTALVEGVLDGTVDMIATDHAPHTAEEKQKGLEHSAMGVVGLETAFPVMYTEFVKKGIFSLERLVELMCVNPRKRFEIPVGDDFTVFDLAKEYEIEPEEFLTMGRATPFAGRRVFGRCIMTTCAGRIVYEEKA